jgi:hypothetical protein
MSDQAQSTPDSGKLPHSTTKPKRPGVRVMFSMRMKREGRYEEFQSALAEVIKERSATGAVVDTRFATTEAMRRMGYQGEAEEKKNHRAWERSQVKHGAEREEEIIRASQKRQADIAALDDEERQLRFETAVSTLPNAADPIREWEWMGAHPAMMRKDRARTDLKRIELTEDDVLRPPHGPAPSKRAVGQLQHWCNNPREFYKAMIGVHKKQQEGTDGEPLDADEDLAEVERLLKEVKRAKPHG